MANIISNFFNKVIADKVQEAVSQELEKKAKAEQIMFSGLPGTYTKDKGLDKPVPKGVSFSTLRAFADYYPIARACINYRKTQISQLDWDISPVSETVELGNGKPKLSPKQKKAIEDLAQLFKYPTGSKGITFRHFTSQLMEDVLVIDALVTYRRNNRGGNTIGYLPVDGSTIKLIVNEDGTIPEPPEDAYIQEIKGKEIGRFTTDEMKYRMMNPKTTTPYGFSPLESLIITVTTALKLQSYNLAYLTEGNIPEGFVEVPTEIASTPEQLKKWQQTWDAMLAGDPKAQSRMRFLPMGMKFTPAKKPDEMSYERFEKWLLQNTCAVFSVAPQDIGFTHETNKATSETQWEVGKERGLFPLANFLKEIFDEVIQEDFGYDDLEFVWTNINPTNRSEEAEVFQKLVDTGAMSVDEWRVGEGLEPIGLGHYIKNGGSIVLVKDFLENAKREAEMAANGGGEVVDQNGNPIQEDTTVNPKDVNQQEGNTPEDNNPKKITTPKPTKEKAVTVKIEKMDKKDILDEVRSLATNPTMVAELRKWKKAAIHDLERGRPFRDFVTSYVDDRTKHFIKDGLGNASNTKEITELFEPFLSPESRVISAVLDLYDDLDTILTSKTKSN